MVLLHIMFIKIEYMLYSRLCVVYETGEGEMEHILCSFIGLFLEDR